MPALLNLKEFCLQGICLINTNRKEAEIRILNGISNKWEVQVNWKANTGRAKFHLYYKLQLN